MSRVGNTRVIIAAIHQRMSDDICHRGDYIAVWYGSPQTRFKPQWHIWQAGGNRWCYYRSITQNYFRVTKMAIIKINQHTCLFVCRIKHVIYKCCIYGTYRANVYSSRMTCLSTCEPLLWLAPIYTVFYNTMMRWKCQMTFQMVTAIE